MVIRGLWCHHPASCVVIRSRDNTFQSGKTDSILVLEQFVTASDTAVAQMVDIVFVADAILQMYCYN